MKKLINRPEAAVEEMVDGLLCVYPHLRRLPGRTVLVQDEPDRSRVALISGGGSGHEPAHAGYVGAGMLAAAVAGDVFTSPSPSAVLAAIRATAGPAGALLIVKNYTGDRLNFGLAAEIARSEGIPVEIVVVADDVALAAEGRHAGRRGLAGTVLVHKVAGAAAAAGLGLDDVAAEARAAAEAVRTMGVALSPCIVPGAERPNFTLGPAEVELGLGIHGEPGVRRVPLDSADAIVDRLVGPILADLGLAGGERVALLINNLGATPPMELAIVARHAVAVLEARSLKVERLYAATFLSALEMGGISLSVMVLDEVRLARLDAPTSAPAWVVRPGRPSERNHESEPMHPEPHERQGSPQTSLGKRLERCLRAAAAALIAAEPELTELDRLAGDGDLGLTLTRGSQAMTRALPTFPLDDPPETFRLLALTLIDALGGTSGPLYAAFCLEISRNLKVEGEKSGPLDDPNHWLAAFLSGCAAISKLGGASPGQRTMLDALFPAALEGFQSAQAGGTAVEVAAIAANAARRGAEATRAMAPTVGRSSYLAERLEGVPDPGAVAVAVWTEAVDEAIRSI